MNDYIGLGTLAVVDGLAPPLPVSSPLIDRTTHVGWMPLTPPVAKREVEVALSGVVTGGLLAAEKLTPATGTARESLNSVNGDGFHLPLVLGLSIDQSALERCLHRAVAAVLQLQDIRQQLRVLREQVASCRLVAVQHLTYD